MRLKTICLATLAMTLLGGAGAGQVSVFVPDANPETGTCNSFPFGTSPITYVAVIPATSLDPAHPALEDIAFAPCFTGSFSSASIYIGFGHVPATLGTSMVFPDPVTSSPGDFLDFKVAWDSTIQGPFTWTLNANTYSPMNLGGTGFVWNGVDDIGFYVTVDGRLGGGSFHRGSSLDRFYTRGAFLAPVSAGHDLAALKMRLDFVASADTVPPVVECSVSLGMLDRLWPPNHTLADVGLTVHATDNHDAPSELLVTVTVFADEDDEESTGDGTHSPDAKDVAAGTLRLRSERRGDADGRVYLIVVRATDSAGNVGSSACTVAVPVSSSNANLAAVQSQAAMALTSFISTDAPPSSFFLAGDGPILGPNQ